MKTKRFGFILLGLAACGSASFAEETKRSIPDSDNHAPGPLVQSPDAEGELFRTDIFGNPDPWLIPENSPLKRFYAGVSLGGMFTDYSDTVDDGSISNIDDNETATAASVFFGYKVNDNLDVEVGYSSLDDVDFDAVSDGTGDSWSAGNVSAEFEADVFMLVLTGRYPLAPRWTLIGKIGFLHWETTETYNENGFVSVDKDSGNSAMIAGGVEYDLGLEKRIKLRGEIGYQRFESENLDMISATLGMVYEFP